MHSSQQTLLITGATGFIGTNLVERVKNHFNVYAISRRIPKNQMFFKHQNIKWIQVDIAEKDVLSEVINKIQSDYKVDFVIHLASFYDFNYDDNPEYYRTNIIGTQNVLDLTKNLKIKRFIFASSVAACEFPRLSGGKITEKTPADANFTYAVTKRKGEELVKAHAKHFKCTTVRFAAAFSDWCEYGPLYMFLNTWLSNSWKSRILGGKGKSAIPYIHVECLVNMLLEIMHRTDELPNFDTYIASSTNSTSHKQLFSLATRFYYGTSKKTINMPKIISFFGVLVMDIIGKITGNRPFERPWMMKYIDKELAVDSSYTFEELFWRPTQRYKIRRRLLFLIENMKSHPFEWHKRNILALKKFKVSPNFKIYEALDYLKNKNISECLDYILDPENYDKFKGYHSIDKFILKKDIMTLYQFLSVAVRSKDRMSIINYAREIAYIRNKQNFDPQEVMNAVKSIGDIVYREIIKQEDLRDMRQEIYDEIMLVFQLVVDEIEGTFESIDRSKNDFFNNLINKE